MQGYNFTERVRRILARSREQAIRHGHEYVGTEHILLGMLQEGDGVASAVMKSLSVDAEAVREKIEGLVKWGRPEGVGPDLPYTSRAKKVLELAMSEARELRHDHVGSEHLLMGLLREEKGIAAQVLTAAGLSVEKARAETLRILGTGSNDGQGDRGGQQRPRDTIPESSRAVPRSVVIVLKHADGWSQQREVGTIQEAIEFLGSQE